MEHIEQAGIHSGDSACVIPPVSIPRSTIGDHPAATPARIARELDVVGLMNIQYAICDDKVYVLEANPRASRTVPLVSKVCGIPMARIATEIMLGKKLADFELRPPRTSRHFGVKEAVFPFNMFPEVDPVLGPEMRSTGEVLGLADSFGLAFFKAQDGAERHPAARPARSSSPWRRATAPGSCSRRPGGSPATGLPHRGHRRHRRLPRRTTASRRRPILKVHEGRPNIVDAIKNGEIQLIINTPSGKLSAYDDSYIRKAAIRHKVPYMTTVRAAAAAAEGIAARQAGESTVRSLQEWLAAVR